MGIKMKNKKLWKATRIMFYITIGLWPLVYFSIFEGSISFALIWIGSSITTFVCSIIHLIKYKEKTFAITALVISSIFNTLFFIGMIIGFLEI